ALRCCKRAVTVACSGDLAVLGVELRARVGRTWVAFLFCDGGRVLGDLHSFPTRRSSDLPRSWSPASASSASCRRSRRRGSRRRRDRKSTRLNSSHVAISYAVFCLKKKHTATRTRTTTSWCHPPPATTPPAGWAPSKRPWG